MFAKFFLDPVNHIPSPQLDTYGVQIKPSDPNQATTKVTANDAIKWIGKDVLRAKLICVIMVRCIIGRSQLPSLHLAQVLEDILPYIVKEFVLIDTQACRDYKYYRTRLSVQAVSYIEDLLEDNDVPDLASLVAICEANEELPKIDIDIKELCWDILLAGSLLLEPENAYVLYVSVTCHQDPLIFMYIAGILLSRINEKRAHYITALAASAASAMKIEDQPKYIVGAVLDFLAGLGLKKWEHCKDDTHNIFPITLATLCCAAISRASRPRMDQFDEALDLLIEYSHRFVGDSCLWEWAARMPLTNPCDRGIGDMDITPLMQAIVFSTAFERRLSCNISCFEVARKTRESVCKRANTPRSRSILEIDTHHLQYVGGICNIMSSVHKPSFQFCQLLRVSLIFGRQAGAPITDARYIGEHWNASIACLQSFERAVTLYLPQMVDQEDWVNVNRLTIPLGSCLAAVIYALSEYCQTERPDDGLRLCCLTSLRRIYSKFSGSEFTELFDATIKELLANYPVGPVLISAGAYIVDLYRKVWLELRSSSESGWWYTIRPFVQLINSDEIKLFWTTLIQSIALLAQSAAGLSRLSPTHAASSRNAKEALNKIADCLRLERQAASGRPDDVAKLSTSIWQIEQIDEFELTF